MQTGNPFVKHILTVFTTIIRGFCASVLQVGILCVKLI